jgi:exopolyphosphatase/guanosine-5'-triphosphate,3'-diphosphate pyrophosphatase
MRSVRLAAIDVGSNSVHMVIADVDPDGRIRVVDRVKEMVRLGRRTFVTGRLAPKAMDLAAQAMTTFGRLARARRVERIQAVATSAVREAANGPEFVRRLRRETGLPVRVISGGDEARLIFRAARHALGLEGGPHLLVDVGGGSVELGLVQDGRPVWLRSLPLGVARLADRFVTADPSRSGHIRQLERHLRREIGELLDQVRHAGLTQAVGTSGTINTLVTMAAAARGADAGRLHGTRATAEEIGRVRRRVLAADVEARALLPGMDAKRVDLMPAAAVLVDFILTRAGAPEIVACGWALREGLLLEMARVGGPAIRGSGARRRSVEALAARFAGENAHGRHVARLALQLFDATRGPLGLPAGARELLEYAALLHDTGHAIDHERHHRHSCYLIRNAELLGFDRLEIEIIAQVARGHRKQVPKTGEPELQALPARSRALVRALAALLRVADGLDRTQFGVVKHLGCTHAAGRTTITIDPGQENAELELWAAERRIDLLAKLLEHPVQLRVQRQRASDQPTRAVASSR